MKQLTFILAFVFMCGCSPQKTLVKPDVPPVQMVNPYAGDEITATDMSFDNALGAVKYTLPKPALVRLRIGLSDGGPLVKNLLEWEPRTAGTHVETWDLKDAAKIFDYANNPRLMVTLQCVDQKAPDKGSDNFRRTFHKSPRFKLEFSNVLRRDHGIVVKGQAVLRVHLDKVDKVWLSRTRHEMIVYIDNNFLVEDEEASDPFNYRLDTTRFNNGRHVMTVNVIAYTGEIGTQSIPVIIENEK